MEEFVIDVNNLEFQYEDPGNAWTFMQEIFGCTIYHKSGKLLVFASGKHAIVDIPEGPALRFVCGEYEMPKPPPPDELEFAASQIKVRMQTAQLCKELVGTHYIIDKNEAGKECGGRLVVDPDVLPREIANGVFIVNKKLYVPPYYYPMLKDVHGYGKVICGETMNNGVARYMVIAWVKGHKPSVPAPILVEPGFENHTLRGVDSDVLPAELRDIVESYLPGNHIFAECPIQTVCCAEYAKALLNYYELSDKYVNVEGIFVRDDKDDVVVETTNRCITFMNYPQPARASWVTDIVIDYPEFDPACWLPLATGLIKDVREGFYVWGERLYFGKNGTGYEIDGRMGDIHSSGQDDKMAWVVASADTRGYVVHFVCDMRTRGWYIHPQFPISSISFFLRDRSAIAERS